MFMLGGCTQILAGKAWFETGHGIYFVVNAINFMRFWALRWEGVPSCIDIDIQPFYKPLCTLWQVCFNMSKSMRRSVSST